MLARYRLSLATALVGISFGCVSENVDCPEGHCGHAIGMLYSEASTLFPPIIQGADDQTISNLIFFPLADIGPDLNTTDASTFIPRLARSWSFEDSLTLVFDMDPAARWHDGQPVTAHDVAFTYLVYMDTLLEVPSRGSLESVAHVTARDDRTAVFTFNRRHPEQLYTATYHMRILPRHLLDSIPRDQFSAHSFTNNPIGNGPFRFVRWNPGESIYLEADTTFFLGQPGLRSIEWRFASDPNTILTPLLSEDADMLPLISGPENIARALETEHLNVLRYDINYYGYFAFNHVDPEQPDQPHALFADPDVRRAIAMAIDRGLVAQTAHGDSALAPSQPATRVVRIFRNEVPVLAFDPEAAKQVLSDEGWTDSDQDGILDRNGQDFEFDLLVPGSSNARIQSATVITSLLEQIGVKVNQHIHEFGVFSERMVDGDFDAYMGSWYVQPSPTGIRGTWTTDGTQNFGRYSNPTVDSLIQLAMEESNADREGQLWGEAFAAMNRDPGALWLYAPSSFAAIHRRFENVSLRPDRWSATMWQWRVREGEWLPRDVPGT